MRFRRMMFRFKDSDHHQAIERRLKELGYRYINSRRVGVYLYTNERGEMYYADALNVNIDLKTLDDLYGKQEEPIYIGEDLVRFEEDGISFGDIFVDKETIREIWEILE